MIATAVDRFDSAGLMVRNIGINPVYGPLMKLALDAARKIHEVNCVAALAWVQKLHKTWMAAHGDSIVNVASIAGIRPAPVIAYYGTSKGPC